MTAGARKKLGSLGTLIDNMRGDVESASSDSMWEQLLPPLHSNWLQGGPSADACCISMRCVSTAFLTRKYTQPALPTSNACHFGSMCSGGGQLGFDLTQTPSSETTALQIRAGAGAAERPDQCAALAAGADAGHAQA